MSSELIKHITDDSFGADVLQADKPVLVDYWAEWFGREPLRSRTA